MKFTGERFIPGEGLDRELEIEHMQRYYSVVEAVRDKIVLDAASGEGYGAYLLSKYAVKVYGIDISSEAISHAKIKYQNDNLEFIVSSIESLPFANHSIDVVVSFETIEHVSEEIQHKFLKEIKRVLKDDGILVMSTPNKKIYSDFPNYHNEFHVKEFYQEEFYDFLTKYFSYVDFYYQKFEVVSQLKNNRNDTITHLSLDNINTDDVEGKYILALCSDQKQHYNLNSIIVENGKYQQMIDRLVQAHYEIEERNAHIKHLDGIISQNHQTIENLRQEINLKNEMLRSKEEIFSLYNKQLDQQIKWSELIKEEIRQKNEMIKTLRMKLEQSKNKVADLNEQLNRKEVELQQKNEIIKKLETEFENSKNKQRLDMLLQKERILQQIYDSEGWKFLLKYYRFRDFIFPINSKRRLAAKLMYKLVKNPKKLVRLTNFQNIKKFNYYLKTERPELLESRIDNYVSRHTEQPKNDIILYKPPSNYELLEFPKYDSPLVSIIIPVYNQFHYTYSCLKSILENTPDIQYEVIIADDGSTDETVNISKIVKNVTVVNDGINRGFLRNCNHASKFAKGKYLLFLNNDTNVQPNWLNSLVELIENDPKIGLVGSKLVYPDGRLQEAGGIIWNDASGWNYGRLDDPELPQYNYVKEVDYISGASIMIRKNLWEEIGGFDERYAPAYFEDSDLAFEVRKHGYKVVYQPKSVVVHFEGISHGTDVNSGIKSYQTSNKQKFLEKWGHVLEKEHFENAKNVFSARDRSHLKKTLLMIDHYVPHFDKDAGSRTVFQYLKLFVEIGFNVKFVGDNFFKHEPYTKRLEEMGIEVLYGNYYASNFKEWLKTNGAYIDYTFLNRPHISIKYIDLIKKYTNSKIIYYGHDLHFLREQREYQVNQNPELLKSSENWKKIETELISKSNVVFYPSQVEIDEVRKLFPDASAEVVPAYIYNSNDVMSHFEGFSRRKDILFVGGFGHRPNIDAVVWFVEEIFPKIVSEIPDIKFYVVGSNPPDVIKNLQSNQIVVTGFISDEELERYYRECKLVVVPLRFGAGVKGKVIEAMYYQVPIVSTDVGVEGLQDIESYIVTANNGQEFANAVVSLYNDTEKLEQLAANSREYVRKHFSKEAVLKVFQKHFEL